MLSLRRSQSGVGGIAATGLAVFAFGLAVYIKTVGPTAAKTKPTNQAA